MIDLKDSSLYTCPQGKSLPPEQVLGSFLNCPEKDEFMYSDEIFLWIIGGFGGGLDPNKLTYSFCRLPSAQLLLASLTRYWQSQSTKLNTIIGQYIKPEQLFDLLDCHKGDNSFFSGSFALQPKKNRWFQMVGYPEASVGYMSFFKPMDTIRTFNIEFYLRNVCNPPALLDALSVVTRATLFSAVAHQHQRRKANAATTGKKIPYINHPIETMNILIQHGGVSDPNTLAAAVLHDTIEDTNVTYAQLVEEFGKHIADIVQECSDDKKLDKVTRKKLQLEHVKHASKEAKLVKLADKYSNSSSPPPNNWSEDELKGYRVWSFAVCQAARGVNLKMDELINSLYHECVHLSQEDIQIRLEHYYEVIKWSKNICLEIV